MESGVEFIAVDFPEANRLTIHILAAVAEHEAAMISARTTAGLKAAKAKGVQLGKTMDMDKQNKGRATQIEIANHKARNVSATISGLRTGGMTLMGISEELNKINVATPRGKQWTPMAVKNALARTYVNQA
jgi:DNA invertase Pin-like site-specific DNA recombinase